MKKSYPFFLVILALIFSLTAMSSDIGESRVYTRVNLVSDIDGVARFSDTNLVNPWGLAFGPTSPFWVADNNGHVSTLYNGRACAGWSWEPFAIVRLALTGKTDPDGRIRNEQ